MTVLRVRPEYNIISICCMCPDVEEENKRWRDIYELSHGYCESCLAVIMEAEGI